MDTTTSSTALRGLRPLAIGYLTLSVGTMLAAALLPGGWIEVTDAVWIRGSLVVLHAILVLVFAAGAVRGSRRAYRRLRIIATVMVVAVVVIVALPGVFPVWMRIEQAGCGLLLTGVVLVVNRRAARECFAADPVSAAQG